MMFFLFIFLTLIGMSLQPEAGLSGSPERSLKKDREHIRMHEQLYIHIID